MGGAIGFQQNDTTPVGPHVRTDNTAPAAVLVKGHPGTVLTFATHRDTEVRCTPGRSSSRLHLGNRRHTITATNSLYLFPRRAVRQGIATAHKTTHTRARAPEGSPAHWRTNRKKNGQHNHTLAE
jgi:hypothetical protein